MCLRVFIQAAMGALVLALSGCKAASTGSVAPPPPPSNAALLLASDEIESARTLYLAKCAKCHKFYNPAHYSDGEWRKWMAKMSRKAKLKPPQEELLSRYLEAYRNPVGAAH